MMLLCKNPMKEYYQREISNLCGVSVGATNQVMKKLFQVEFVTQEKKGKMYFYKANLKNPLVKQFKIFMNISYIFPLIRELREYSRMIILFGSCSNGTDVEESDIDLLIIATGKTYVRKKVAGFNKKSERKISPIIIDMNEFVKLRKEDKALYRNIKKGIVVWEKE
jgi:predicted nucleotidyltransferase